MMNDYLTDNEKKLKTLILEGISDIKQSEIFPNTKSQSCNPDINIQTTQLELLESPFRDSTTVSYKMLKTLRHMQALCIEKEITTAAYQNTMKVLKQIKQWVDSNTDLHEESKRKLLLEIAQVVVQLRSKVIIGSI